MMDRIMDEVLAEVAAATRKFPTWPTDPLHALAVLGEEFGELTKDVLQLTYEPHKTNAANVRKEAIQTAAMALRFAASLDTYEYRPGVQHSQGAAPKAASEGDQYIGMTLSDLDRASGGQPSADNLIQVDRGALQMALNVLRRAGKNEVADALAESATDGVAPSHGETLPRHTPAPDSVEEQNND